MKQQSTSRDSDKVMVRMPDGMRTQIAEEARRSFRSANAQIVWMLQQMMERMGKPTTGESLQAEAPAAGHHETALQGGPITHG